LLSKKSHKQGTTSATAESLHRLLKLGCSSRLKLDEFEGVVAAAYEVDDDADIDCRAA
jgi:hypothetical protein